ncbi:MAG: hypothetical protein PHY93_16665, partial [Bacteriovorax sp.]|nr:hypothetical protein [Bacteriovorax sp.]
LVTNTFENVSAYAGQDSNHLDHAQYIRHNRDGVIGMSGALTGDKEAYAGGANKLIVVAHSQGNEVLFSAIKDLRNDPTFLATPEDVKKIDGLVGYMQVAPPSPRLVTINSFEMRPSSSLLPHLSLCRVPDAHSSCSFVVRANLYTFEKNWSRRAMLELRG